MQKIFAVLLVGLVCLSAAPAIAQTVLQGGLTVPPVPGHVPRWITNQLIGDSGPANGGPPGYGITELNITNDPKTPTIAPLCINDAPLTNPGGYHQTCFGSNVGSQGGLLSYGAFNGAGQKPFTLTATGPLVLSSQTNNIQAKNLPANIAGSGQLCVSPTTGVLSMASAGVQCGGGLSPAQALLLNGGGNILLNGGGRILLN